MKEEWMKLIDDKIIEVCNGKIVGKYEGRMDETDR